MHPYIGYFSTTFSSCYPVVTVNGLAWLLFVKVERKLIVSSYFTQFQATYMWIFFEAVYMLTTGFIFHNNFAHPLLHGVSGTTPLTQLSKVAKHICDCR